MMTYTGAKSWKLFTVCRTNVGRINKTTLYKLLYYNILIIFM